MTPETRRSYYAAHRQSQKTAGVRRVAVTVTGEEFQALSVSAKRFGESPTAHLKSLAFSALEDRYLVPADSADQLASLVAVLRGIGNNLNQMARHSNEMRAFMDTGDVRLKLARMEEAITTFVADPPRQNATKESLR